MVIQVNYQTKRDAADPHAEVEHTEFFESSAIPDKTTIGHELIQMRKDFAENTIAISEYKTKSAEELRASGVTVTKIY
jgi:hypothetical protein